MYPILCQVAIFFSFISFSYLKNKFFRLSFFIIFFNLLFSISFAQELEQLLQEGSQKSITVDLKEPSYSDGVLSTDKGGVISGPCLRIQALHLCYTRKMVNQSLVWTIEAEGDLIVEFGDYIFVGKKIFYDFQAKEGLIEQGRTTVEPWYFGGETLELRSDGSLIIYQGYLTTSEKDVPDWDIYSQKICIENQQNVQARHVHVRLFNRTLLWIPSLKVNLDYIFDNPIRYRFRWGGRQGPRIGLTYELFSWQRWKTFVRFDYRITRGPGGGIEMRYQSPDHKTNFQSIFYLAKDSSILHIHEKARFRFEGMFQKSMDKDKTKIFFTYDKISDRDMPSNYYDRDFEFDTSERTQLLIRRQENQWISTFYARVRVNSFQTVKQELPSLQVNFKPFELKQAGIIFENFSSASYLNFKYAKFLPHVKDYSSTRFEYNPNFYRPFQWGSFLTITPEAGLITILYGDSPKRGEQWVGVGKAGVNIQTQLYRCYGPLKHVIKPYAFYRYYSAPTSSAHHHYIFDLSDGLARLNYLSFGIQNALYAKIDENQIRRIFAVNTYAYAFFNTDKLRQTIPRIYSDFTFFYYPNLKHTFNTAWNLDYHQLDHFNFHSQWTLNENFAISLEYRYRSAYTWRKVDQNNFFLDVFRSENRLRHSALSDRRETLLLHFFYRFHPNWACEFTSRQGWHRLKEPKYLEFEFDILTTIQTAWHLRFSIQHQENDDRVALYLNVGLKPPSPIEDSKTIYQYD